METTCLKEAIILAGGRGTRLRSISGDLPKPMMPVGEKPFLEYLLHRLNNAGIKRVILSVGYKHEIISAYFGCEFRGMHLTYSIEECPLGTGGAVAKAFHYTDDDTVAVFNGDSYFDVDLAGIFSYVDNGENVERKFYVRTCVNQDVSLDGGEHQSTRESDLNLQL